jgi:hypothetical protein
MNNSQNSDPYVHQLGGINTQLSNSSLEHQHSSTDLPPEILRAATLNWQVFPVQPKGRFAVATALLGQATHNLDQLEKWAIEYPDCNWALATGAISEVFVVEMDGDHGRDALFTMFWYASDWNRTLHAQAGESLFAFFRRPSGFHLRNASKKIAPGLSIHGEGDYVLIPPSTYSSGITHCWLDPDETVAATPQWLLETVFTASDEQVSEAVLPFPRILLQKTAPADAQEKVTLAKILPFISRTSSVS